MTRTPPPTPTRDRVLLVTTTALLLLAMAALGGADAPVDAARSVAGLSDGDAAAAPAEPEPVGRGPAATEDGPTAPAVEAVPDQEPAPEPVPADVERPEPWSVGVHAGLGAWIDLFDWSVWGSGSTTPPVGLETIDALAAQGVRTLYVQTGRINMPDAVVEPERLQALIDRAHEHDMFVVGWYLPEFADVEQDMRRIEAAMALDIDGFALDIESQEVADTAERTRRLLEMSQWLHELAGDRVLVANPLPPVQMEELAPSMWPDFPWAELGEYYDVFMPMGYFTFREDGHHWRDAEAYTAENVRRIRERVGDPDLPVHFIGGIADLMSVEDVQGMTRGARATDAIGLSVYDVVTTGSELWEPMQAWRDLGE